MPITRRSPMLAPHEVPNLSDLRYPMLMSQKMDGIRCVMIDHHCMSRSGKDLPNKNLQGRYSTLLARLAHKGGILDGELWSPTKTFNEIQSIVMSHNAPLSDIGFYAFDHVDVTDWVNKRNPLGFEDRLGLIDFYTSEDFWSVKVEHVRVACAAEAQRYYDDWLEAGHEGAIIRSPRGGYKWGRCTTREHNMFKLKAFDDMDCVVIGYEPLTRMDPHAEREFDELGRPKQVHSLADRYVCDLLGALRVKNEDGVVFKVGSGFTDKMRADLWKEKDTLEGRWCLVRSTAFGVKEAPRQGIFHGFRDPK